LILVAESRLEHLKGYIKSEKVEIRKSGIPGASLVGNVRYSNPFNVTETQPIISVDFVTENMGTGLVHIAPGHGQEDYIAGKAYGLEPFAPVDHRGQFTADALSSNPAVLQGKSVLSDGSEAVLSYLRSLELPNSKANQQILVVATHDIVHKYPIDWRTKQPVIIKATDQWFADIDSIKAAAIKALESVKFLPETGKARLRAFVEGRSQWCISRQRAWGMPIPALYRTDVSPREAVMTPESIDHIMNTIRERGIDAWWSDAEDESTWIPSGLEGSYVRGKDTMDVWFDSGTSWSLLDKSFDKPPANVYLEGSDQHRGWFQSSLLTYVSEQVGQNNSITPKAPFKTLITHGFTLDPEGRKMSKSLGNVISPDEIIFGKLLPPLKQRKTKGNSTNSTNSTSHTYDAMGADVLRYWVASTDYTKDVSIGPNVVKTVQFNLQKLRITFKWLLGVLSIYNHSDTNENTGSTGNTGSTTPLVDTIALHSLAKVSSTVRDGFQAYDFVRGISAINAYVHQDLSAFYFETLKDRLYTGTSADRQAGQAVLYHIFNELLVMLGPITPLLVEEVWSLAPDHLKDKLEHPLRRSWTPFELTDSQYSPIELDVLYKHLSTAKRLVGVLQEPLRKEGKIGSSLQSEIVFSLVPWQQTPEFGRGDLAKSLFVPENAEMLAATLVVSKVKVNDAKPGEVATLDNTNVAELEGDENNGNPAEIALVANIKEPSGCKCERCWRYLDLTEHGLCGRCDDVVGTEHTELLNKER
jgi:isoleucyl-tRNA synthetase